MGFILAILLTQVLIPVHVDRLEVKDAARHLIFSRRQDSRTYSARCPLILEARRCRQDDFASYLVCSDKLYDGILQVHSKESRDVQTLCINAIPGHVGSPSIPFMRRTCGRIHLHHSNGLQQGVDEFEQYARGRGKALDWYG